MKQIYAIALVDLDDALNASLNSLLTQTGDFNVSQTEPFDIVLTSSPQTVQKLRESQFNAPILLLTKEDKKGCGESDSLTLPLRFAELLTRIKAQLRQFEVSEEAVFPLGHYIFQPGAKQLLQENGEKVKLTDKEAAILNYLRRNTHEPVTREQLLTNVWGYHSEVTTHTLETHIYRLRQKIEGSNLLITEQGGYRLNL